EGGEGDGRVEGARRAVPASPPRGRSFVIDADRGSRKGGRAGDHPLHGRARGVLPRGSRFEKPRVQLSGSLSAHGRGERLGSGSSGSARTMTLRPSANWAPNVS